MLTYAIAHMFQLFNYCYAGHELSIQVIKRRQSSITISLLINRFQSGKMAIAIYNCKWEDSFDSKLKKSVMFMIERSQKLQTFKAGNITEVNLVSYVAVYQNK